MNVSFFWSKKRAFPSSSDTMKPGIPIVSPPPKAPGNGVPFTLFATMAANPPAASIFRTFSEKKQPPRSTITIKPSKLRSSKGSHPRWLPCLPSAYWNLPSTEVLCSSIVTVHGKCVALYCSSALVDRIDLYLPGAVVCPTLTAVKAVPGVPVQYGASPQFPLEAIVSVPIAVAASMA